MKLLYYTCIALHEDIYAPKLAGMKTVNCTHTSYAFPPTAHSRGTNFTSTCTLKRDDLYSKSSIIRADRSLKCSLEL